MIPYARLQPSQLLISKQLYSFRKIKTIYNYNFKYPLALHYYQLQSSNDKTVNKLRYNVLDISNLDYGFYYLPYIHYYPNRYRISMDFPPIYHITHINDEIKEMKQYYNMNNEYDYYKIDENLYINFSTNDIPPEYEKQLIQVNTQINN